MAGDAGGPRRRPSVVVAGGGVSGLAVAFELLERSERLPGGIDLRCHEAADRPGGGVRTTRRDGFLCEWGPHGLLDNAPHTQTLVRRLGLHERLIETRPGTVDRFVFRRGRLRRLPRGAGEVLGSRLLSLPGTLRAAAEPLARAPADDGDPSVHEFVARRFGREAAEVLADALVTGIYAGDARRTSMPSAFPRMWQAAVEHGGVVRAMLARRRGGAGDAASPAPSAPGRARLLGFRDGMQELTGALAAALGPRLHPGTRVVAVGDMGRRGFRVLLNRGAPLDVDAVVLATPAAETAEILAGTDGELTDALAELPTAPIAVVHLGFREAELADRPRGFGFLAPRREGLRLLGTLWASEVFAGRAPEGRLLWTTMIGGAHDPEALELPDDELVARVRRDLATATGVRAEPVFHEVVRHHRGIPQYDVGHRERLATIDRALARHPGLHLSGWSYRGIGVNACLAEAPQVAEAVLARLARPVPPS